MSCLSTTILSMGIHCHESELRTWMTKDTVAIHIYFHRTDDKLDQFITVLGDLPTGPQRRQKRPFKRSLWRTRVTRHHRRKCLGESNFRRRRFLSVIHPPSPTSDSVESTLMTSAYHTRNTQSRPDLAELGYASLFSRSWRIHLALVNLVR